MRTKFHYILILFVFIIIYLIYLIARYTYEQFQVDSYIENVKMRNAEQEKINQVKQFQSEYIRTKAYHTLVAKKSQGKKLPAESVFHIVGAGEASANSEEETRRIIAENQKRTNNPLRNMDNPQKWNFIFQHGINKFQEYNR
ncbi:hypothetical protein CSB09_04700 [Candidatus Gracilibacteria bacterium]|nr:MAG: hypothetical protein CSB09_04700 [Candidatus Gracilibacteria bacterium]